MAARKQNKRHDRLAYIGRAAEMLVSLSEETDKFTWFARILRKVEHDGRCPTEDMVCWEFLFAGMHEHAKSLFDAYTDRLECVLKAVTLREEEE